MIVSQPVTNLPIEDWDVYTGTVKAKESVDIKTRVRGEIKKILFEEGTEVKANTPLFVLDDVPFKADLAQAKGELATWQAKLEAAEKKIKIYEPLEKSGTVAKEELIQAYAAKGEAVGGKETAKGKILDADNNIRYCNIIAPIDGKIGEPAFKIGAIVGASASDSVLANMVSVDPEYVYFYVTERALLNYQKNMLQRVAKDKTTGKLILPVRMALANETDFPHKGVVDFGDIKVDEKTGTYKVRAIFPNEKGPNGQRPLVPGLFARIRVGVSEPYTPVLVADRAILSDQSLKYVLIVDKNKVVQRVDILPSGRLQPNGLRAVEGGLKGDEWVIVEGVNRVRPGVTVNPTEREMPRRPAGAN